MAADALSKTITSFAHYQQLRKGLDETQETPMFTKGSWAFPKSQLILWYKDGEASSRIQFPNSSNVELKLLSEACQPATFGRNHKDVLDESYRLARKMDARDFSINLGFEFYEMLTQAVSRLFGVENSDKSFRAQLYKLNVYGPGSFFKAHKDTPRADNMFGSLVLVLPTEHEGGALLLRDGTKEFRFESDECHESPAGSVSVPWAAFYSQVEHEVLPVVSGYRVTLTYVSLICFSANGYH
ncbi:hypothetical protein SISNIDRAFT_459978, partial [Sistotremastrum niveocremeum HHB9708]